MELKLSERFLEKIQKYGSPPTLISVDDAKEYGEIILLEERLDAIAKKHGL